MESRPEKIIALPTEHACALCGRKPNNFTTVAPIIICRVPRAWNTPFHKHLIFIVDRQSRRLYPTSPPT